MAETKILEVNGKKFSIKDVTNEQTCSQDPKSASIDKTLQDTLTALKLERDELNTNLDAWIKYGNETNAELETSKKENAENLDLYNQWKKYGEEAAADVEKLKVKAKECKKESAENLDLYRQWEKYGNEVAVTAEEFKARAEKCEKDKKGGSRKSKEYLKYKKEYIKLKNQL